MRTIKQVQSDESLGDRSRFPEEMKGKIAKDLWNDSVFKFGMEYGYLLALLDLKDRESKQIDSQLDEILHPENYNWTIV